MAVVSLGTVCNTKASDDNDTTEDKIVLSVVTQLQDHVNLENGKIACNASVCDCKKTELSKHRIFVCDCKETELSKHRKFCL